MTPADTDPHKPRPIRIHKTVWALYGDLCKRTWGQARAARINAHILNDFATRGTPEEQVAVTEAVGALPGAGRPREHGPGEAQRMEALQSLAKLHAAGYLTAEELAAAQARVLEAATTR